MRRLPELGLDAWGTTVPRRFASDRNVHHAQGSQTPCNRQSLSRPPFSQEIRPEESSSSVELADQRSYGRLAIDLVSLPQRLKPPGGAQALPRPVENRNLTRDCKPATLRNARLPTALFRRFAGRKADSLAPRKTNHCPQGWLATPRSQRPRSLREDSANYAPLYARRLQCQ